MEEEQTETRCPACGARYWVGPEQIGAVAECSECAHEFTVTDAHADNGGANATLIMEENVAHAGLTISSYMRGHGVEGGVSLEDTGSAKAVLETDSGRKYAVGDMLAKGGMGAILNCRDLNIRRSVAMKVMLNPKTVDGPQLLRFIEEAQITGQLEHPGIVPVHELGVDASETIFYTMKLVHGKTLKDILADIKAGDQETVTGFPLSRLLTIFQRICEAVGYAHHKNVIHRDLKPDNIMVGDFGEVYVMDWGLAKVLRTVEGGRLRVESGESENSFSLDRSRPREHGCGDAAAPGVSVDRSRPREHGCGDAAAPGGWVDRSRPREHSSVSSARNDAPVEGINTLDGAIMGTPHYMAPEQAKGKVSELDPRADIYALGGILYEILSLQRAVDAKSLMALLIKVSKGDLTPLPTDADLAARPHCPTGRIPDSLAAVAMKALALNPDDRYATVQALQADVERYQSGFATVAEQAGLARQLGLLVRRHKGFVTAAALVFLAVSIGLVVSLAQWRQAVASEKAAVAAKTQAVASEEAAVAARAETEKALAEAQRENYANVIALADRKIATGEILQAEDMLWDTPKELRGWEWGRCLYLCHQELLTLSGPVSSGVYDLAFSPDGMRLVSTTRARIWDMSTGLACLELNSPDSTHCAVFSPDGRRVATGHNHGSVVLWDAVSGAKLMTLSGHKNSVGSIAFSPDGSRIASAESDPYGQAEDCSALVWDAATGQCLTSLKGHNGGIVSVAFSPDSQRLVTASRDGTVRIWEAQSSKELLSIGVPPAYSAVFSPDGASVCIGAILGVAGMWDATTGGKRVTFTGHRAAVYSATLSPDGTRAVTAGSDRTARVWDAKTGKELLCIRTQALVYSSALAPNGRLLATGGVGGAIRLWDVSREGGTVATTGMPAGFTDGHSRLITVYGSIKEWDAGTGKHLREVGQIEPVCTCALSADELRLVTGYSDGKVAIWDVQTGGKLFDLSGHSEHVWSVAFSPDGTRVVSSSDPAKSGEANTVFLWDATTGRRLFALTGHEKRVRSACFSPDGQRIITGSDDATARIWDAASGQERSAFRLPGEDGRSVIVMAAAFSPDGRQVAIGYYNNVVVIWDVESGQQLRVLNGHSHCLESVAFSPDGCRVFTTARDLSLRVWDAETGRELLALSGSSLADVSADGRSLAVYAGGRTLVLNTLDWSISREDIGPWKLATYQTWLAANGMKNVAVQR